MTTILLAGDVHSNPGPACDVEQKTLSDTPVFVNSIELYQGSESQFIISNAVSQKAIFHPSDCLQRTPQYNGG